MKKILSTILIAALGAPLLSSCIDETLPQSNTVTEKQAAEAPGSYDNFVKTITTSLAGKRVYRPSDSGLVYDFGLPSFFLSRDALGQDIVCGGSNNWFDTWYQVRSALGPGYAACQFPWTLYYTWIDNCNTVIRMAGETPDAGKITGAGIAHAMRAMFYMDIARMFAAKPYSLDKNAETVPLVTGNEADLTHNPRATNEAMWKVILADLDKAEQYIANYERPDVYTPNISVVYGLKARAYLETQDWAQAEKYAKLAQKGFTVMSGDEYTSKENGFNSPNGAWMFALKYVQEDPNILDNDGDSSWGSVMQLESTSGMGYASNYGGPQSIDRHLYETIPETDVRKKCFISFAIDELGSKAEQVEALKEYAYKESETYATSIWNSAQTAKKSIGGLSVKFRANGGDEGRANQKIGFSVSVPVMRVEEMKLIEAEAAGMQDQARGIALLTEFARLRDPNYEYGKHNEAYGNTKTSAFQNEVWWQRRVELWGEGFATFDIKRLNKGIIRSYPNTNHQENYRWNTPSYPHWMNLCIIETELRYNLDCTQNDLPVPPTSDSPEYKW